MRSINKIRVGITAGLMAVSLSAYAQFYSDPKPLGTPQGQPAILKTVGIDQHLNQLLPLNTKFRDESSQTVELNRYFGTRPVVFALVYYTCPMLCNEVQSGLASVLDVLKFNAGREFDVVAISINPHETEKDAQKKKHQFLMRYKRPGAESGVHFLTGDQTSIDAVAKAAGFRYNFDPKSGQYAHASAIMVATPEGKIAQYFYGIEYSPKDLRLALVEASQNKIGNVVDQVLLLCFHYDPSTGRYSATVLNVVKLAGISTVLGLGLFMFISLRREKGEAHT